MWQSFLLWMIDWAERHLDGQREAWWLYVTLPPPDVLVMIEQHIQKWRTHEAASGEYKRDQCYKAVIRQFPGVPRAQIALGIEVCYQRD